ncbi:hypothetical protein [Vibrio alfacsensis]|uniref:hypothetical protein n=1 Tax=Vibrio alfacsensis TaxID=1074311 RepID=UPI001C81B8AE|nr:hypothetical protein [Vibrio alfacsensis]
MSLNHTVTVSSEVSQQSSEMKMIKNVLITKGKPISERGIYSLPLGVAGDNYHTLPDSFGFPLRNKDGRNYLYCPYGIYDSSSSDELVVLPTGGYKADIVSVGGVDYVTYTSKVVFPEIKAFIISPDIDDGIDCSDVMYDQNTSVYYATNGKVEWITNNEIHNYFITNNLSSETEHLTVSSENQNEILNLVANDTSNKNYSLTFVDNLSVSMVDVERNKSKTSNIHFNLGSNAIVGNTQLNFLNVNIVIDANNIEKVISDNNAVLNLKNSTLTVNNAQIPKINAINSDIDFNDDVKINSSGSNITTSTINLLNSNLTTWGNLVLENKDNTHDSFLTLTNSEFATFGNLKMLGGSRLQAMRISQNSVFYQNDNDVTFSGDSEIGVDLRGSYISDGLQSKINIDKNGMKNLIVVDGGYLNLSNASLLTSGSIVSDVVIEEIGKSQYLSGKGTIKGSPNCWSGESFQSTDFSDNGSNSSSNKTNNNSSWICVN